MPLDAPFTREEIRTAVFSLADNKASGPDGLINEFAKKQWTTVSDDLLLIFEKLHQGTLQLCEFNQAHIVLIPKKDSSSKVEDFRPISVINYVPKLISKVLANRMKPTLSELISAGQTGFLSGRFIAENFNCAREILHHAETSKTPGILLKLDFAKAFDSVTWPFLLQILHTRGFPQKFITWIHLLLSTATSSILLDGIPGRPFIHRTGLRQGDPLSPYLFLLVADVLSAMLAKATADLGTQLTNRLKQPFYLFQYADDALIFSSVKGQTLQTLKLVLHNFSEVSGLQINFSKSSFVPLNLDATTIDLVRITLNCTDTTLPIPYLGLPLTSKNPDRVCFQPLLEKLQRRLASWKGKLITRAGRLQLVSSVLSSIPIYHFSCFRLPRWLLDKIERLSRNFLWNNSNIPLKNWKSCCLPKVHGGLGIIDLALQNKALLLRWWWRLYSSNSSLWFSVMAEIYSRNHNPLTPPLTWLSSGSFFWKELFQLRLLFQLSTRWDVVNAASISFWFDAWGGAPLIYLRPKIERTHKPYLCLQKALPVITQLLPMPRDLRTDHICQEISSDMLSQGRDKIFWKWSQDGSYSSKGTYSHFISGGKTVSPIAWVWKLRVPPKVKLFSLLLLQGKLLTQEVLIKRNIHIEVGCAMCSSLLVEDNLHLFFTCPYSSSLWTILNQLIRMPIPVVKDSLFDTTLTSCNVLRKNRGKLSFFFTSLWIIWEERNNRRFRGEGRPTHVLARRIAEDGALFNKFC